MKIERSPIGEMSDSNDTWIPECYKFEIAFNTRSDIFSAKWLTSSNSGIFRLLTRLEMAAQAKKVEHTEVFIDAWRR